MIRRVLGALASLIALAGLLVGLPVALWVLGRQWLPYHVPTLAEIGTVLGRPDDGSLFAGALVLIGFGCWVCLAASFLIELPSQLGLLRRTVRMPRGLRWSQHIAGGLLAAVLSISVSQVAGAAPVSASAAVSAPVAGSGVTTPVTAPLAAPPAPAPAPAPTAAPTYVVVRGDTLWDLADRLLGDGARYPEIVNLNLGVVQRDGEALQVAGDINAGWVLTLPAAAAVPTAAAAQVVVEPGDTLSGIAAEQGLPSWQPIFEANAGEVQPGGGLFTDPDLIFPGQALDIPVDQASTPVPPVVVDVEPAPAPVPVPPQAEPVPDPLPAPGQPGEKAGRAGAEQESPAPDTGTADADDPEQEQSSLLLALSGAGALLAAGVGAAFWVHRRRRFFRRRPGRALTATPPALRSVEVTLRAAAAEAEAEFLTLDLALRSLALQLAETSDGHLPEVVAARIGQGRLDLILDQDAPTPAPHPWVSRAGGSVWAVQLDADFPVDLVRARRRLAPYPALVTVGLAGDGGRWLLDLERAGTLRLTGPDGTCEDFARHLVAELVVTAWADVNDVTLVGFGGELVGLRPDRLTVVGDLAEAAAALQARLTDNEAVAATHNVGVLDGRLHAIAGDSWMPAIVVVAGQAAANTVAVEGIATTIADGAERRAVAVVVGGSVPPAGAGLLLELAADGTLLIADLDLTLQAPQLSASDAADIAALLDHERAAGDEPMPAAPGVEPWQRYVDVAGGLRPEHRMPRDGGRGAGQDSDEAQRRGESAHGRDSASSPGAAGDLSSITAVLDSVLPYPTSTYTDATAATTEDLDVLAPRVPAEAAAFMEAAGVDELDGDLLAWWDEDCARPRLSLLGPIQLRVGSAPPIRRRSDELIAYVATRELGSARSEEIAAALRPDSDPTDARAHVHRVVRDARKSLGTAEDGQPRLVSAREGPYRIRELLLDAELFFKLRVRAAGRGPDGLADLQAALELVSGEPFGQRGKTGYEWLENLDHHYTGMICDVAHLVATAALAADDIAAARDAVAAGLRAAPGDVKILTDAVWVAYAEGNHAEAEAYVAALITSCGVELEEELEVYLSIEEARRTARAS